MLDQMPSKVHNGKFCKNRKMCKNAATSRCLHLLSKMSMTKSKLIVYFVLQLAAIKSSCLLPPPLLLPPRRCA